MAAHDSERPAVVDSTGLSLSWRMVFLSIAGIASVVVLMVSLFPFLFSMSKVTVATRDYVEQTVDVASTAQAEQIAGIKVEIKSLTSKVDDTTYGVARIETSLTKQRASQEAERVTAPIKSASERVSVYQRVYEANLKKLPKGEDPVKPQDVEDYR